jgi:hypothetical protein
MLDRAEAMFAAHRNIRESAGPGESYLAWQILTEG